MLRGLRALLGGFHDLLLVGGKNLPWMIVVIFAILRIKSAYKVTFAPRSVNWRPQILSSPTGSLSLHEDPALEFEGYGKNSSPGMPAFNT